jgi:hypothetical protein
MKILLLILFFYVSLVASNFEESYKSLNKEIDKISHKLTLGEKVSLYYLTLSTHDRILTLKSNNSTNSESFRTTKSRMILALEDLKKNKDLTKDEIIHLRSLYANMNHSAKGMLLNVEKSSHSMQKVYKEVNKNPYVKTILFAFTTLLIFISSILGYLLYQSKNTNISKDGFFMINELKSQNTQLSEQVIKLQTAQEEQSSNQEEILPHYLDKSKEETLNREIEDLKKHIVSLHQELLSGESRT